MKQKKKLTMSNNEQTPERSIANTPNSSTEPLLNKELPKIRWVKVGDNIVAELPKEADLKTSFVIEIGSDYQLEISNVDGILKVTNGVNGYGNNCRKDFENTPVTILREELPTLEPEQGEEEIKQKILTVLENCSEWADGFMEFDYKEAVGHIYQLFKNKQP